MPNEFKVHKLNEDGLLKATYLADEFTTLLAKIEKLVPSGYERKKVVEHLQEACFYAKRGMALQKGYQEEE